MKKNIVLSIFLLFALTICGCSTSSSGNYIGSLTERDDTDSDNGLADGSSTEPGVPRCDFIISTKDKMEKPFEFVKIVLNEDAKNNSYTETADVEGKTIFRDVPFGNYTVSFPGFSDEKASITVDQETSVYEFSVAASKIDKVSLIITDENNVEIDGLNSNVKLIPNGRFADASDYFKDAVELSYNTGTKTWDSPDNIDFSSGVYAIYVENLNNHLLRGEITTITAGANKSDRSATIQTIKTKEFAKIGSINITDEKGRSYEGLARHGRTIFRNKQKGSIFYYPCNYNSIPVFVDDLYTVSIPEYASGTKLILLKNCYNDIRVILNRAIMLPSFRINRLSCPLESSGNLKWYDDKGRIQHEIKLANTYDLGQSPFENSWSTLIYSTMTGYWNPSKSLPTGVAQLILLHYEYEDPDIPGSKNDIIICNHSGPVEIKTSSSILNPITVSLP